MRTLIGFLAIALFTGAAESQTTVSGDLLSHLDSLISSIPSGNGTNQYEAPNTVERSIWGTIIEQMLAAEYRTADSLSGILGYQLLEFQDTGYPSGGTHYILQRTRTSSSYWGIYVVNPAPLRGEVMIMCPHALHDRNSGRQGAYVYRAVAPRMLGINGAHRCNSSLYSPCSGTTTACGSPSQSFRLSDQAHVVDGFFQLTTEALLGAIDSNVQIQLHGFSKTASDPDIIMSNGTSFPPPPGKDHLVALRDNLALADPTMTFKVGHVDTGWTRLLGTTNVQGRLINGSPSPCTFAASSATGRFLHMEQKYTGLRDTEAGWELVAGAIGMTFPTIPTDVRTPEPTLPAEFHLYQNYPNPFNPVTTIQVDIPESRYMSIVVTDILGRTVAKLLDGDRPAGTTRVMWDASGMPSGAYLCVVRAGELRATLRMMVVK